jgi:hypothetical protein
MVRSALASGEDQQGVWLRGLGRRYRWIAQLVHAVGNTPLETVIKPILPIIGIPTVTVLIITYVPNMYLPRLLRLVD